MSFTLLSYDTFYKKDLTVGSSTWDNGVLIKEEDTVTYPEIQGLIEPYSEGEASFTLPSGVGSSDSKVFHTETKLVTHESLDEGSTLADRIYFENPVINPDTSVYVVYEGENWGSNSSFNLISTSYEYLLIREGLV